MHPGQERWADASKANQWLARAFLLAGRLRPGFRAVERALRLADRGDASQDRASSYACRAYTRGLRGETDAALADFRHALHWQHEVDGETSWSLYSDRGCFHAVLLAHLGHNREATRLTEENQRACIRAVGTPDHIVSPDIRLILSGLARERGELAEARQLLAQAHDWAVARDAKEVLCWAALVRGRIELSAFSLQRSAGNEEDAKAHLEAAGAAIEEGLRIARECGFGIFHVDLLVERARVALMVGDAEAAERDARVALEEGVHPAEETGLPELLAATDPECGYAWGEGDARHLLAEALLLRAAQSLGSAAFDPAAEAPPDVRDLIDRARAQLEQSLTLRGRIQDPKAEQTEQLLEALDRGELTAYPLEPPTEPEPEEPELPKPVRDQVFISYSHRDKEWLERLQVHLKPYVRRELVDAWDDTRIEAGARWRQEIDAALDRAKVAVLLVSPDFLASDFIGTVELPRLLDAEEREGVTILWVPISASAYKVTEIAGYQAAHNPAQPLDTLSPAEQNRALVEICKAISRALNP